MAATWSRLKWTMENEFGVKPGEVFWAASDVGWVVGHSYIVYGPLLHGCTSVLFEGKPVGTPDAGTYWRVIAEHGVVALFTAPTAFRAIKGQDPKGEFVPKYDLSKFRTLFLAGERADPETIKWAEQKLNVPVIDHWWQTETGSPMTINPAGLGLLPVKYGSPGVPMPGYDIRVLDDAGHEVPRGTLGNVVVKLPLPAGCLPTLWNADERFRQAYLDEFPGFYKTADAGMIDEDGYLYVMARTDDIINVAGHRLSTGAMEEVLAAHPDVAECAVIGIADAMKGQVPLGFVVLNAGVDARYRRHRERSGRPGARADRPGRRLQDGGDDQAPAQDALRQDPARHHAEDRRQGRMDDAGDHRRSGHPRRDHRGAEGTRIRTVEDISPSRSDGNEASRCLSNRIGTASLGKFGNSGSPVAALWNFRCEACIHVLQARHDRALQNRNHLAASIEPQSVALFQRSTKPRTAARERLEMDMQDTVVYAIGDVHGCYKELRSLEQKILLDSQAFRGRKIIIMLGDYVDRGIQSARVLDHLMAPPPKGFLRVCLAGNHEVAMLNYLDGYLSREPWLAAGGLETLFSYGVDPARLSRPLWFKRRGRPAHPRGNSRRPYPLHAHAADHDLLEDIRFRSRRHQARHRPRRAGLTTTCSTSARISSKRLIVSTDGWCTGIRRWTFPRLDGRRLGIDTGAFQSGRLTAVRIADKHGRLIFS